MIITKLQNSKKNLSLKSFFQFNQCGSYILSEDIFSYMPNGRHSLERDVFPKLASQEDLNGKEFEGYFIDAGTPPWMEGVGLYRTI